MLVLPLKLYKLTLPSEQRSLVIMALEAKYRLDGESRMQELHDQLANLQVTAADKYDPARVFQELRRIWVELGALGVCRSPRSQEPRVLQGAP